MQVKLNPLWNVFNKSAWAYLISSVVFFCIILGVSIYSGDYSALIFVAAVLTAGNIFMLFWHFPHSFKVWEGQLQYNRSFLARITFGGKNRRRIHTALTVRQIESVELKQNAFEKMCNTGRVTFTGRAEVEFLRNYSELYKDQVTAPLHHTFYGVKDFESFRNKIYDHVDPSILQIHVS